MSGIDPNQINTYTYGVGGKPQKETKGDKSGEAQQDSAPKPEVNHKPANEVLDMMARQGAMNIVNVTEPSVESRIAESMALFEQEVVTGLQGLEQEFGGALSEQDMLALAAQLALGDIE